MDNTPPPPPRLPPHPLFPILNLGSYSVNPVDMWITAGTKMVFRAGADAVFDHRGQKKGPSSAKNRGPKRLPARKRAKNQDGRRMKRRLAVQLTGPAATSTAF